MTADATLASELSALQKELSAAQRDRPSPSADREPHGEKAKPAQAEKTAEERQITEQLHDLVNHIKQFAEEAEQNMAEHPTATVVGALLLGILIGRLLGRR